MAKYVYKDPQVYTVIQWTGDNFDEVKEGLRAGDIEYRYGKKGPELSYCDDGGAAIISAGDYIVIDAGGSLHGSADNIDYLKKVDNG